MGSIESDCFPPPSKSWYCDQGNDRYEHRRRVAHVIVSLRTGARLRRQRNPQEISQHHERRFPFIEAEAA